MFAAVKFNPLATTKSYMYKNPAAPIHLFSPCQLLCHGVKVLMPMLATWTSILNSKHLDIAHTHDVVLIHCTESCHTEQHCNFSDFFFERKKVERADLPFQLSFFRKKKQATSGPLNHINKYKTTVLVCQDGNTTDHIEY
jgi:hypothetical protein